MNVLNRKGGGGMLEAYERKKLLRYWFFLLMIPIYLALVLIWYGSLQKKLDSFNERIYREYIDQWKGAATEDTRAAIEAEKAKLDELQQKYTLAQQAYMQGDMPRDEFYAISEEYDYFLDHQAAFTRVYDTYQYFLSREDPELSSETQLKARDKLPAPEFFQDTSWAQYLNMPPFLLLLLAVLLGAALPYHAAEHECGMRQLLRLSSGGARVLRLKRNYTVLLAAGLALCSCLAEGIILLITTDADVWRVPVQSTPYWRDCYLPLTFGAAFALQTVLRILGFSLVALLIARLSSAIRNIITVLLITVSFPGVPAVIEGAALPVLSYGFLWHRLLLGAAAFREQPPGQTAMFVAVAAVVSAGAAVCLWRDSFRGSGKRSRA